MSSETPAPEQPRQCVTEYGVMSDLATTVCRGGRREAQEHLLHRRSLGHEVTLVSRLRAEGDSDEDGWEDECEVYSTACVGGCGKVFDLPEPVGGAFLCRRCGVVR